MLKLLGWMIKASIFAAVVLVIGNLVRWHGRTVSDQIKTGIAHAERMELPEKAKDLALGFTNLASTKKTAPVTAVAPIGQAPLKSFKTAKSSESASSPERIAPSERQKLRALIRELNGAHASRVSGNP